jgi:lysophospholipase L1-like esterase
VSAPADVPVDWLVRFHNLPKLLELHDVPVRKTWTDELSARALGVAVDELERLRCHQRERLLATARDLRPRRLPFADDAVVVGVGDSITSDALSWFELVRAAARQLRSGATFVNAAISGDTSADVRKRAFRIRALRADWILLMIGTNDCQRHAPLGERLVTRRETASNLRALQVALRPASIVWVTPPLVAPQLLSAMSALTARGLSFTVEDLRQVAQAMRGLAGPVVDVQGRFEHGDDRLWEDGVHPTPGGHRLIADEVLGALARL